MKPHNLILASLTMAFPWLVATEPERNLKLAANPMTVEKSLPNPFENHWDARSWEEENSGFWHVPTKPVVASKKPKAAPEPAKTEANSQKKNEK
jgi:hypothetical protein